MRRKKKCLAQSRKRKQQEQEQKQTASASVSASVSSSSATATATVVVPARPSSSQLSTLESIPISGIIRGTIFALLLETQQIRFDWYWFLRFFLIQSKIVVRVPCATNNSTQYHFIHHVHSLFFFFYCCIICFTCKCFLVSRCILCHVAFDPACNHVPFYLIRRLRQCDGRRK